MHKSQPYLGVDSPSAPEHSPLIQAALTFTCLPSWEKKQTSSFNLFSTTDLACLSVPIRAGLRRGDECCSEAPLCSGRAFSHCHPSSVCQPAPSFYLNLGSLYSIRPLNPNNRLFYSTKPQWGALKLTYMKSHNGNLQSHLVRCPFTKLNSFQLRGDFNVIGCWYFDKITS